MTKRPMVGLLAPLLATLYLGACDSGNAGNADLGGVGDGEVDSPEVRDLAATTDGVDATAADGMSLDAAVSDLASDACTPTITGCAGLCGPVTDRCSKTKYECGGCKGGHVCDMVGHKCVKPLTSCAALLAQCGAIRNSCGERLDCGDCPAGKECDPDTNTCVTCKQVTCQDLGYQCGKAWLGCGPQTTLTDCGACPKGKVCNTTYRVCESKCTPQSKAQICAAAKAARGVECGTISNGCGGLVDCGGCPPGKRCGVRGVANRCEVPELPDECKVQNRECGSVKTPCGKTVKCGDCQKGQVCNPNGKCGPPCTPKTCAKDYPGKCGQQLSDGCGGKLTCGCSKGGTGCNAKGVGVTGVCVARKSCATYGATGTPGKPCSNGASPSFPRGDGVNLTCRCTSGGVCLDAGGKVVGGGAKGACCKNIASCSATNACTVTDTCTKRTINCCRGGYFCDRKSNTCKRQNTCATFLARGRAGDPCSNGASPKFPRGDGPNLTCRCTGGRVCVDSSGKVVRGSADGTCCQNTTTCPGLGGPCTVKHSCTGANINCCTGSLYCDTGSNTCKRENTCATFGANGNSGDPCSNGYSPAFPRGDGRNLRCRCRGGRYCVKNGKNVTGTDAGTCCQNTSACPGLNGPCQVVNSCTGATINCCRGTLFCDSSTSKCLREKTCASFGANGLSGNPCSNGGAFDRGDGVKLTCRCSGGRICSAAGRTVSGSTKGTCCTNTATCSGASTCSVINTCSGAKIGCCTSSQYCGPANTCQAKKTCASYGANGKIGDLCSTVASTAFPRGDGVNLKCGCSTAGMPNNRCTGSSATKAGKCTCTPATCGGRVGVFDNLCGGTISCGG